MTQPGRIGTTAAASILALSFHVGCDAGDKTPAAMADSGSSAGSTSHAGSGGSGLGGTGPGGAGAGGASPCDLSANFAAPTLVMGLPDLLGPARPSVDRLRTLFADGLDGRWAPWMATRSAVEESFGQPVHLSSIDDGVGQHQDPVLSFDGGTVFFERDNEIFSVESSALDGVPATPKRLALNEPGIRQFHPYPSHDGERLYFARTAGVTDGLPYEIWYARRVGADYGNPEAVLGMQAPGEHRFWPVVSRDELTIYFSAYPVGDIGAAPAYLARRPSIDEPFGQAVLLRGEEFDVPFPIEGTISWVSPDDCEMWLRLPYPLDLAGVTMAHRPTLQ